MKERQLQTTQVAIVGNYEGGFGLSTEAHVAEAVGDIVVVRTKAVALNPVDTKMTGPFVSAGAILGSDFAGIVEQTGPDSDRYGFRNGNRVCGVVMGMNPLEPALGAFAELVGCHASVLLRMPDHVGFDEAASMNMGCMTAGMALFKVLDVPGYPLQPLGAKLKGSRPSSSESPPAMVLVYGGSTATGTIATQLLRLAGLQVIATCSPAKFDMLKSYGADAVFDYRDPNCTADIRTFTRNSLRYVLDCISTTQSMELCYAVIGRSGGRYASLEPYSQAIAATRKRISADWVLAPTMLGRPIDWPAPYRRPAMPEMVEFTARWSKTVQVLFDQSLLRPHPLIVRTGELGDVLQGLEEVKAGSLSGKKLVYLL